MAQFLMVVPQGWVEVENATDLIVAWGENGIWDSLAQHDWGTFDAMLEAAGWLPSGKTIGEAVVFDTGESGATKFRMWVTVIDIPIEPQLT